MKGLEDSMLTMKSGTKPIMAVSYNMEALYQKPLKAIEMAAYVPVKLCNMAG